MERWKLEVSESAIFTPPLVLLKQFVPGCEDREREFCRVGPFDDAVALSHSGESFYESWLLSFESAVDRLIESVVNILPRQLFRRHAEQAIRGNIGATMFVVLNSIDLQNFR